MEEGQRQSLPPGAGDRSPKAHLEVQQPVDDRGGSSCQVGCGGPRTDGDALQAQAHSRGPRSLPGSASSAGWPSAPTLTSPSLTSAAPYYGRGRRIRQIKPTEIGNAL